MSWISAGAARVESLPPEHLTPEEMQELHRLLAARQAVIDQLAVIDQRLELLLIGARDRRGLSGRVQVDPETGAVRREET